MLVEKTATFLGAFALSASLLMLGCDRNIEPYRDDPVAQPDLARIFPEGARADGERPPIMPDASAAEPTAATTRGNPGTEAPLRGRITLSPELEGRVPQGAVLFVIARVGEAGPPTAVLRVPNVRFPMSFEIGPEHRMIQQLPFAGPFTLTARVDADGNAMTRQPGDLQGAAEGTYNPGAEEIELVINESQ